MRKIFQLDGKLVLKKDIPKKAKFIREFVVHKEIWETREFTNDKAEVRSNINSIVKDNLEKSKNRKKT